MYLCKMKQTVRISGFGDYIALDFISDNNEKIETPFYIKNNKTVEVHWARPSDERPSNPIDYDDFYEKYVFKMENGLLSVAWLNGPCPIPTYNKLEPTDLVDWRFQYAYKIISE